MRQPIWNLGEKEAGIPLLYGMAGGYASCSVFLIRKILEQVGCGMAADMQAMRIDLLLGPGMNIQRDPMCGRNFEYFSEDPLISGKMASAMVRGPSEPARRRWMH
mgnify:CR=1 FL=1